jgi:hypothetical protein
MLAAALSMSNTTKTLVVAIVGILASGLIGPAATAWATRRANRQQFERDQRAKSRDDFRALVDDAAKLLGAGVTNLRLCREAKERDADEPEEVKEWASKVHLLRQRLLLRRSSEDSVLTSYVTVLDALGNVGSSDGEDAYREAVTSYERSMETFLAAARSSLESPVA